MTADFDSLTGFDFRTDPPLTRAKAIRAKCLECNRLSSAEVKVCHIYDCAIWPYRLGKGVCTDPEGEIVKTKAVSESQREHARQMGEAQRGETP